MVMKEKFNIFTYQMFFTGFKYARLQFCYRKKFSNRINLTTMKTKLNFKRSDY